jgi:hypothetical protein
MMAWLLRRDRRRRLKQGQFSVACGHEVGSAGTDDKLNNKAAGVALRTRPTGAAAGGRRLCLCCLLAEIPRMYQDTLEALPDF